MHDLLDDPGDGGGEVGPMLSEGRDELGSEVV